MRISFNKKQKNTDKTKESVVHQHQFHHKLIQQSRQLHQLPFIQQYETNETRIDLQVEAALHILRQKSLAHFYSIYKDLIHTIRSTEIERMEQIQQLKMHHLIHLIEIKASIFGEIFYILFHDLEDFVQKIKSKLGIKQNLTQLIWRIIQNNKKIKSRDRADQINKQLESLIRRIVEYQQHPMDTQFLNILQIIETSMNRQAYQVVKQKYFKKLISSNQFQPVKYYWKQIFQKLQTYKRRRYLTKENQFERSSLQHIEHEKLMSVNCLKCIKFMYKNAVIQPSYTQLVAVFPYIHRLKQYQTEVKQKINLMMSSGGGVILFDCLSQLFNIRIQGAKISQKQKEAFEQMLISYLPSFYPQLKMNQNIFISFVPIVQISNTKELSFSFYKGQEAWMKQGQKYIERQYVQGHYVCRVIVRPFEDRRVTFWMKKQGFYQTYRLNINNKEQPFKNLRKHIKKSMVSTFIIQEIDTNYKKMVSYFHDHKCISIPEQGIPTTNKKKVLQLEQFKSHAKLEDEYNYISIMIAKSKHLPNIKQKLKRYGDKVYLDRPFASYKFKHNNHSAVLYHNIKFQTLLKEVCFNKEFIYDGKNVLTINVTAFLKFKKRNQQSMFGYQYAQNINDWLHKEFPNQKLKFWQFINQKNTMQYYLQTQSKLSTLFLYHMLENYGEEVIFKSPNGLDKMSWQERTHRFRELHFLSQSKQFCCECQPITDTYLEEIQAIKQSKTKLDRCEVTR